jgi:hypothetical protein
MKSLIILLFVSIFSLQNYSQEAIALHPLNDNPEYIIPGEYDNALFTNINLSVFIGPQNEPSIRISRANPNIIVCAWRDFRLGWDPNPVRRIGYTYSTNGGSTWAVSQLLPDPNPTHTSQSDPVVINDAQGNFYISSTSRQPVAGYNRDMLIYKSTNNGQTFFYHAIAVPGSGGAGEDKEWIFCDPVQSNPTYNNIFITWTSFGASQGIKFRKSTDGASTWSSTVNVGDNTSGQGSNNCSGTNGYIYVVWQASGVRFDKSTNGGTSFGTDFQLSNVVSTNGFPFICCDYSTHGSRGNIYVVWDDTRGGNSDVYVQRSTNAGANWLAAPVRVNDVTTGSQYWPVIQCDTNGYLYVIYYDTRLGASQVNSYIAYSTDQGTTWVNNRLSDVSFPEIEVGSDARFGDYINVDAYAGKIMTAWTDDRAGTPDQEIYTANLTNLTGIQPVTNIIPDKFNLYQNYPNPFNPVTKIRIDIQKTSYVRLKIYDLTGKLVKYPVDENLSSGSYLIDFNASELPSGIYLYELTAGEYKEAKKMVLVK